MLEMYIDHGMESKALIRGRRRKSTNAKLIVSAKHQYLGAILHTFSTLKFCACTHTLLYCPHTSLSFTLLQYANNQWHLDAD